MSSPKTLSNRLAHRPTRVLFLLAARPFVPQVARMKDCLLHALFAPTA